MSERIGARDRASATAASGSTPVSASAVTIGADPASGAPAPGRRVAAPAPSSGSRSAAALGSDATLVVAAGPRERVDLADYTPPPRLGRYLTLETLGAGGMGIVVAAYDPELDRKVALKFIREGLDDSDHRRRMIREAQALARLSHPNVVTVYEVREFEGQVFVAMEFVRGETLRAWLGRRPRAGAWREILEVFEGAGRGLVAAHEAGLVHRDFKPDNVMIGDDGRPRVMDFGLAREDRATASDGVIVTLREAQSSSALASVMTRDGAILGTPVYMAPEQWAPGSIDARADQFAFCVALWEALHGARPFAGDNWGELAAAVTGGRIEPAPAGARVPPWLVSVLRRGLLADPDARWPSVAALLGALSAGQRRHRRRPAWFVASAVVVAGLALVGARHLDESRTIAGCEAAGRAIEGVWNDEARASLRASLLATGMAHAGATYDSAARWIDRWTTEWSTTRTDECLAAEVEGTRAPALHAAAMACLEERRDQLAGLLEALQEVDAGVAAQAVPAAASLPQLHACVDPTALVRRPAPVDDASVAARVTALRRQLARVQGLDRVGRYGEGWTRAEAILREAEGLGDRSLTCEAGLLVGDLAVRAGELARGEEALRSTYVEAGAIGADEIAATAATRLIRAVGVIGERHAEGELWVDSAEMWVRRLGQGESLRRADLLSGVAALRQARGDYEGAIPGYQDALEMRRSILGDDHPDVGAALNNLANAHAIAGKFVEARALQRQALAIRERTLGPDHPDVAASLGNLANVEDELGERDEALALQTRALEIRERSLGPLHPEVAHSLNNLAVIHRLRGDLAEARALQERARGIRERAFGPRHPEVATTLMNLAIVLVELGELDEARAMHEEALSIQIEAYGKVHPSVGLSLTNLADVLMRMGDVAGAGTRYQEALTVEEATFGPEHPELAYALIGLGKVALAEGRAAEALPALERALRIRERADSDPRLVADARFTLARALWGSPGGDRERARDEATRAREVLRERGEAEELAKVDAWFAAHVEGDGR
ncbi:MAG: serine/threonine-protein kinase [Nannocystaceae bacterium]